jgi:hypothetical protein
MLCACECKDSDCPVHAPYPICLLGSRYRVYHTDMEDETGTAMCELCAADACDSGFFQIEEA